MKPILRSFAVLKHVLAGSVRQVVKVLHRRHGKYAAGGLDLADGHLAETNVADQPLVDHALDDGKLFLARHAGVDAVQLPQIDAGHTQPFDTPFDALAEIGRLSLWNPLTGTWPC